MRAYLLLFSFLVLFSCTSVNQTTQDIPLVYEVENTGVDCPTPYMPPLDELPIINALPDPFQWSDGRGRIATVADWTCRRAEIAAEVQHYELGEKPAKPDDVSAHMNGDTLVITVSVNGKSLTMHAAITLPDSGDGPFPAVIGIGRGTGTLPVDVFTSRGVATIVYNFMEVVPWTQQGRGMGAYFELYPDETVGYFTPWAWGVSRLIDGLQAVPETNIDTKHLAITGCSFAGKIALFSGAFDERIALTLAQEPGGGGDAAWRVTEMLGGSREILSRANGMYWYRQDFNQFDDAVTKLPYDHHEVMAMIAPRALLVMGNPDYPWLADESGYVACMAAKEVWKAMGVPDRFGFSKVPDHQHCQLPDSQIPELAAFIEKFLLGDDSVTTEVAIHPGYESDLASWIPWSTPKLAPNGASYQGVTELLQPENNARDVETDIELSWTAVDDAEQYLLQVSTDAIFSNVFINMTLTETTAAINNLTENKNYYWRVQAVNAAGEGGPWSHPHKLRTIAKQP